MKEMRGMKQKLHALIKGQRGDGVISVLFIILIVLILSLIAVSIYQYSAIRGNLQTATNETLQIVKVENGADETTRAKFNGLLEKMGMDPSKVTFNATPKTVQRGDPVEVTASYDYNVFALKAIGVNFTVKIQVKSTGLAHKFVR